MVLDSAETHPHLCDRGAAFQANEVHLDAGSSLSCIASFAFGPTCTLSAWPCAAFTKSGSNHAPSSTSSQANASREGSVTGAMALTSRNASVPADGQRPLGNPHRSADETGGARDAVPVPRTFGGAARFHLEDAGNAGRRFGIGAQAPEGVSAMSKKHMGSSIDDFVKEEGGL